MKIREKSVQELESSCLGISDVTCEQGTRMACFVAERLLELKLVNGSCKVPALET